MTRHYNYNTIANVLQYIYSVIMYYSYSFICISTCTYVHVGNQWLGTGTVCTIANTGIFNVLVHVHM